MFSFNDLLIGIPTEIGPRILYFASKECPKFNMFRILPEAGAPTSQHQRVFGTFMAVTDCGVHLKRNLDLTRWITSLFR